MMIDIDRKALLAALNSVSGVIEKKPSMPILGHVLLDAHGADTSILRIGASGNQMSSALDIPCAVQVALSTTAPADHLTALVKSMSSERVTLSLDMGDSRDARMLVQGGKARYKVPTLPSRDYPKLHAAMNTYQQIATPGLLQAIDRVQACMAEDEIARPSLSALCLTGSKAVAVNGTTMGVADFAGLEHAVDMLIPRRALAELIRFCNAGYIEMSLEENRLFLRNGCARLSLQLLPAGSFPQWGSIVQEGFERCATVPRDALQDALRRIALVASDSTMGVRFTLSTGLLKLESDNDKLGSGVEEIEIEYAGRDTALGLHCRYLSAIHGARSASHVKLELQADDMMPVTLRPDGCPDHFGLIMPMRI